MEMWCYKACVLSRMQLPYATFFKNGLNERQFHTSSCLAAGHSKWANIRHIKALKDGQKSALFTRYARQIRLAVQEGGSADPVLNSILRNVVDDALRKNMPMATIQNSIKKSGQNKALLKKHFLYWRHQQKVFAVCVLYTDNFAQLKMELAPIMKKSGTVNIDGQHMFDDIGIIEAIVNEETRSKIKSTSELEQIVTEDAIDCGVEEVEVVDHKSGTVNFFCNAIELSRVTRELKSRGYVIESSEHVFIPKATLQLSDDELRTYQNFLKKVRDIPGIEEIYDNLNLNPE